MIEMFELALKEGFKAVVAEAITTTIQTSTYEMEKTALEPLGVDVPKPREEKEKPKYSPQELALLDQVRAHILELQKQNPITSPSSLPQVA